MNTEHQTHGIFYEVSNIYRVTIVSSGGSIALIFFFGGGGKNWVDIFFAYFLIKIKVNNYWT